MFSDKLGTLLLSLTATEWQRLGKFVASAYFNENVQVVRLFEALRKSATKGDLDHISKPQLWKQANLSGTYADAPLRKLIYELTQLTYRFLSVEVIEKDAWEENKLLQRAVNRAGLDKHQSSFERRCADLLADAPTWRTEHYLRAHAHTFTLLDQDTPDTDLPDQLRASKQHLDIFFLLRTIKMAITLKTYAVSRKYETDTDAYMVLVEQMMSTELRDVPLVRAYYQAYHCLAQPDDEQRYRALKAELVSMTALIDRRDLFDLYQYALNFSVLRINAGDQAYYRELFELYRSMTEDGLLLATGELAEGMFKNVITAGLAVREFEWVEQFIREQSRHLPETVRENAMSFNLANVFFSQRKFNDVIGLLQRVEYSDLVYQLGARWLLIRTYYELDATKPLDSLLDSFRVFLLRNKVISAGTKKEYLSLISFTRLLLKSKYEKAKLRSLKAKVMTTQIKLPKRWLVEKIEELEKR